MEKAHSNAKHARIPPAVQQLWFSLEMGFDLHLGLPKYPHTGFSGSVFGSMAIYCALGLAGSAGMTPPAHANSSTPPQTQANSEYWRCTADESQQWQCGEAKAPAKQASNKVISAQESAKRHPLDWVTKDKLTPEEQTTLNSNCCGMYQEPLRTDTEANTPPNQATTKIESDQANWQNQQQLNMTGKVTITKGSLQLEADNVSMKASDSHAKLKGNISFRQPGLLIRGENAQVNQTTGTASVENTQFVMHQHHIRGKAERLEKNVDNTVVLLGGSITSCEPNNNDWAMKGAEIRLDPDKRQGTIKHMRLNVANVPVFYAPYLRFPLGEERMSGFLFPTFSSSNDNGVELSLPYYLNLADNLDATLTPHFIEARGTSLEAEVRHLSPLFATDVRGAYLGSDDEPHDGEIDGELQDNPFYEESRWLLNLEQKGSFGKHLGATWFSKIDTTKVSDEDYFRDMNPASLDTNADTHMRQFGTLGFRGEHWQGALDIERYQVIHQDVSTPYKQLPKLSLNGQYQWLLPWGDLLNTTWNELSLDLNHEHIEFDHQDETQTTGKRARLDYQLQWQNHWQSGFIIPSLSLQHISYQLDENQVTPLAEDNPSVTAAGAGIDMGLFFERDTHWLGSHFIQTLEPRLFYQYTDYEDQSNQPLFDTSTPTFSYSQLFHSERFHGGDRIGDNNQVSIGVTSRFIDSENGTENFSASLGQIFYMDDRRVNLNGVSDDANRNSKSNYAARLSGRFYQWWTLATDLEWSADNDQGQSNATKTSFSLRYQDDQFNLFSLGYRYDTDNQTTDIIEQAETSFILPLIGGWSAIGRYQHDLENDRELETLAGLEYDNCCWRIQATYRQGVDEQLRDLYAENLEMEYSLMFTIQFKGLAGVGSGATSVLGRNVPGYTAREAYLQSRSKLLPDSSN